MAEGDTLYRTARLLRPMVGERVVAARAWPGPGVRRVADLSRIVGARVGSVEAVGKNLLIGFDNGLTIRSHLGMSGSWRRIDPDRSRTPSRKPSAIIETTAGGAIALDTPVIELLTATGLRRSPHLATLGPDLLAEGFEPGEALRRFREHPARALGDALLDQRLMAGVGNVYKSEVAFIERLDPWSPLSAFSDQALRGAIGRARELLQANVDGGRRSTTGRRRPGQDLWVYRRTGRPCRRCGTTIVSRPQGRHVRMTYWCPRCQAPPGATATDG